LQVRGIFRNFSITQGKMAGKLLIESGHADPLS
jgi:hypothetical protein